MGLKKSQNQSTLSIVFPKKNREQPENWNYLISAWNEKSDINSFEIENVKS